MYKKLLVTLYNLVAPSHSYDFTVKIKILFFVAFNISNPLKVVEKRTKWQSYIKVTYNLKDGLINRTKIEIIASLVLINY